MFITLEGPDGAGKSTAMRIIAESLRAEGLAVHTTRQPGDSSIGVPVREILLGGPRIEPLAELFLFLADRAQHVAEVIRPALARNEIVLCDRYADSTVVYQGYARGLDIETLRTLNELATENLRPDLTLLLEVDAESAQRRNNDRNRLDQEPLEFHERVLEGFRAEAARDPARWVKIDALPSAEIVAKACLAAIRQRLATKSRNEE